MDSLQEPLDGLLMAVASKHKSIPELLKTLFSFLHRRTDFYVVDDSPTRRMGFKAGVAERLVRSPGGGIRVANRRRHSPVAVARCIPLVSPQSRPVEPRRGSAGSLLYQ